MRVLGGRGPPPALKAVKKKPNTTLSSFGQEREAQRAALEAARALAELHACADGLGAELLLAIVTELAADCIVDAAQKGRTSDSQAGHIDQWTPGDEIAKKAEEAKAKAVALQKAHQLAKMQAMGLA